MPLWKEDFPIPPTDSSIPDGAVALPANESPYATSSDTLVEEETNISNDSHASSTTNILDILSDQLDLLNTIDHSVHKIPGTNYYSLPSYLINLNGNMLNALKR